CWRTLFLGWVQSCKPLHESAITSFRKSCEIYPGSGPIAWLGQVYATAGYRAEALKILEQLQELSKQQYVTPYGVGRIYAALVQREEAVGSKPPTRSAGIGWSSLRLTLSSTICVPIHAFRT